MVVGLKELAQQILVDLDAGTPGRLVGKPLDLTTAQTYALQAEIARLREERGERVLGYKVGCTSRPIREQLGVQESIFGRIFDTGCFRSASLSYARFANLAVEGELAVRLGKDLSGSTVSEEACRAAVEAVFPVIELHHYTLPPAWPPIQWLIASSGMHTGFVLADSKPHAAESSNIAHSLCVRINDVVVGAVKDTTSLTTYPIESLRWLVGRLSQFGLQLYEGQVILTGSPLPLLPVALGDRIVVEAPPLGVSCVEITR